MPNRKIPYWIFQLTKLIDIFYVNGYRLIYKAVYGQTLYNFDNFSDEYKVCDSCNFSFERISSDL